MQRGSAGHSQLKVSTVFDNLSAIRTCFAQAGVSFTWPERAYKFVKGESVARRQLGVDRPTVKAPFMPRLAQILDQYLLLQRSCNSFPATAAMAVLLCFYFGWRSSTVSEVQACHITYNAALNVFRFSEQFSKGAFAT